MIIYETDLKKEQCVDYDEAVANVRKRSHLLFSSAVESLTGRDFIALEILKSIIANPVANKSESIYLDSIVMAEKFIKELYQVIVINPDINLFYNNVSKKYQLSKNKEEFDFLANQGWEDVSQNPNHKEQVEKTRRGNV